MTLCPACGHDHNGPSTACCPVCRQESAPVHTPQPVGGAAPGGTLPCGKCGGEKRHVCAGCDKAGVVLSDGRIWRLGAGPPSSLTAEERYALDSLQSIAPTCDDIQATGALADMMLVCAAAERLDRDLAATTVAPVDVRGVRFCHRHEQARGECSECRRCDRCDAKAKSLEVYRAEGARLDASLDAAIALLNDSNANRKGG